MPSASWQFLSTPSARRATRPGGRFRIRGEISIHALREEGDPTAGGLDLLGQGFLSTPSARRATSVDSGRVFGGTHFYPRPPRGGRPDGGIHRGRRHDISIHALREEGDAVWSAQTMGYFYFYPRPPRGGRPEQRLLVLDGLDISIHALREEGDRYKLILSGTPVQFLSTPSARRATCRVCLCKAPPGNFYPRPPRGGRRSTFGQSWTQPENFYPRPPRGGRPVHREVPGLVAGISIHALREEGDCPQRASPPQPFDFYPRPPRGGRLTKTAGTTC